MVIPPMLGIKSTCEAVFKFIVDTPIMALTTEEVLGWSRVGVLLIGMGWAAWMDHKDRRVSNSHWLVWVKPAIFLWCLELLARGRLDNLPKLLL